MRTRILFVVISLTLLSAQKVQPAQLVNYDSRFAGKLAHAVSSPPAMRRAEQTLALTVPGLSVQYHPVLGSPEIVGVKGGRRFLTLPSTQRRETILREFLAENAALYGLTSEQIGQLRTIADYTNPDGNLSYVKLEQVIHGIPVFRGQLRAAFTSRGELVRTVGELIPYLDYELLTEKPGISSAEALKIAGSIGTPMVTAPTLQYFPLRSGVAVLAWSMILKQADSEWFVLIDAATGNILFRKNLINDQSQNATYSFYPSDSPSPLSPTNATPGSGIQGAGVGRTILTLISELPAFDNLGWLTDGVNTTTGNNVDAGFDVDGTDGIDPGGRPTGSPFRVFDFSYNPPPLGSDDPAGSNFRFGAVTNVFVWANRYHDILYQLGFTEAEGNFQTDNFGRGGSGNDPVIAQIQEITNNASFQTPADGKSGVLRIGVFTNPLPNRDADLDQDVLIHEFTHGVSNRLHADSKGLNFLQSGGMGEGWSDFYARSLLSDASEDPKGLFAAGAYSTLDFVLDGNMLGLDNYYYGVRRFPYAVKSNKGANGKPHNPLTLADIDPLQIDTTDGAFPESPINWSESGAQEVHNIGEIWCSALLEVRSRMISSLGFGTGNQRMLQLVTDGMKFDPPDPSLLDGRDSILAADCASHNGEDEQAIWKGFAVRGMGFSAQDLPAFFPISVTEAFDMPNVVVEPVEFTETKTAPACQNGFADPGEKLTLTIPLRNPLCASPAKKVVASMGRDNQQKYGTISEGATVARDFPVKVPKKTACGSQITFDLDVTSSLGKTTREIQVQVGQPIIAFAENFDGIAPPNLPSGWTTSASGALSPWVTTTAESDTAPNSAFGSEPDGGGDSELVSPIISITNPDATLTFRHFVGIKSASDASLEISIGGAPFEDMKVAGGTFLEGGYNDFNGWSGNSAAFFTTLVQLPAAAAGQDIQLRWAFFSSSSGINGTGWAVDSISITDGYACCP
jgi:extracellular elastinolytic metalloproteinase